ncbi:MAG: SBBP repeat-containing protein [Bacteroidetes bacterium]|nr:SBBP repeat-containing protein [Bacteroidota bacterium]
MKTQLFVFILLLAAVSGNSQNCFWAKSAGGTNEDGGRSIATDGNGNVYVTGFFKSTSITFGSTILTNNNPGADAYYIVKYSSGGSVLWAKSAYGGAIGYGITTDADGYVYVTGNFTTTSVTFDTTALTGNAIGFGDVFIVKYDTGGNVLWAKGTGGNSYDFGYGIAVDGGGNAYVTGSFYSSSITFGDTTFNNNGSGNTDFFIAKYDSSGNVIWAGNAGSNRYDDGYGVTVVGSNVYVTGSFQGDSIRFGNTTLFNSEPGNYVLFVAEYDSAGNVIWTMGTQGLWGSVIGNAIAHDAAGNIYITGSFSSVSVIFGSTTLVHSSSGGNNDIFIIKYNTGGNVVWAKGVGSQNTDNSYGISASATDNIYITGCFYSNYIIFGMDTLYNYGSNDPDIFIAKYDTAGNALWAKKAGGTGMDIGWAIAAGLGDNVYFTGKYVSTPASFGDVSLNPVGYFDMFTADIYNFSSAIVSFTDATCYSADNGTAVTTTSGGNQPYTYLWNTTPPQSTSSVNNLSAGNFTVTITESFGCAQTSSVTITEPPMDSARICMVTVDSLSQYNIIVWDKTQFNSVDSFIVFREITTNNYQPIARIPYDSLSMFVDTVRTLYFPNTGDPNNGTYRYKISVHDTCGSYSDMSPYHNTIYFLNNSGTFYWTQPYTIENGANPVSNYILMRDDNSTGNWQAVASVAGTQQVISDPLYAVYQSTASWRVKTQWNISCSPTLKNNTNYIYSLSNIYNNLITFSDENYSENPVIIYPNPTDGQIIIFAPGQSIRELNIYSIIGERFYTSSATNTGKPITINISDFRQGIYFLHIRTSDGVVVKKMTKE